MSLQLETTLAHLGAWPGVTYGMQWGEHLLFKVEGKMFAVLSLDDVRVTAYAFKVNSPAHFDTLTETEGIVRMPHSTGKNWVKVYPEAGVSQVIAFDWLRGSYEKIRSGLPKKTQALLLAQEPTGS